MAHPTTSVSSLGVLSESQIRIQSANPPYTGDHPSATSVTLTQDDPRSSPYCTPRDSLSQSSTATTYPSSDTCIEQSVPVLGPGHDSGVTPEESSSPADPIPPLPNVPVGNRSQGAGSQSPRADASSYYIKCIYSCDTSDIKYIRPKQYKELLWFKWFVSFYYMVNFQLIEFEKAVDILYVYICPQAMFDGDNRDDAPRCFPGTRKSIIDDIGPWAINADSEIGIVWLTGAIGTGKSAIARTVCENLNARDPRLLAGSFFFLREDNNRNTAKAFVPTIAYHLAVVMPEVGEQIRTALVNNPAILEETIWNQWEALVIRPLCQAQANPHSSCRSLIVVDGLDECEPDSSQLEILQLLTTLEEYGLHRQVAFLISCRSESHIQSKFHLLTTNSSFQLRHIVLSNTEELQRDMQLVLTSGFSNIYQHFQHITAKDHQWPPKEAISQIIDQANGQFCYIAAVIQWTGERYGNPVERLLQAISDSDKKAHIFALLDCLYDEVLKKAYKTSESLIILCLFFIISEEGHFSCIAKPGLLGKLFQKDSNYIRNILQPLCSVIQVPGDVLGKIKIFDRHCAAYLLDKQRSGKYSVRNEEISNQLLIQALQLDYVHLGFGSAEQNLGMLWLWLPLRAIVAASVPVNVIMHTAAYHWLHIYIVQHKDEILEIKYIKNRCKNFCKWLLSNNFSNKQKVFKFINP
ncbi:hypothetical protein AX16_006643 [Volvariella volvacea WC 439]|nr:hypothetical protein AX16_006643 [Volvariella volvacea WC 439]